MPFFKTIMPRIILLMGGPGTGKSFIASKFTNTCSHISTGEILRGVVNNTAHPEALKIAAIMRRGDLVPDHTVVQLLGNHPALRSNKPILLDGFPRTMPQWMLYQQQFGAPTAVIHFMLSREEMRARLHARRRSDDNLDAIEHRIDEYFNSIASVGEEIKNQCQGKVSVINTDATPEVVCARFDNALKLHLEPKHTTPVSTEAEEEIAARIRIARI